MEEKHIQISSDEFESMVEKLGFLVKKLRFLDESNTALIALQDKIERLSQSHSEMILSHDPQQVLETGLSTFGELVKAKVCSVFLVDEEKLEFVHKISIPETFSSAVQKEVDAQIDSGSFGWVINKGLPTCIPTEVIGKDTNQPLSIMLTPLSHRNSTIGAAAIVFEHDQDFVRQQTMKLLYLIAGFFSLSLENAYLFDDLKRGYFDTIRAVTNSIDARDPYTRGHSQRVGVIAKTIAEELDWSQEEKDVIDWGAALHDMGKIGIPDVILKKPGKLTDEENGVIKSHPSIGAEIVKEISFLEPIMPYVLEHHERYDGKGYPKGLAGDNISIKARLLAVADCYDAMTTDRPYRKGLETQTA
ncbi:MAG: HD domain-containing protein, partial [Desulfobacterales bacterium]|nr:HD domain-containing protein [Desulfobacterales bacterium]